MLKLIILISSLSQISNCFRVYKDDSQISENEYFEPYDKGFVGYTVDPMNFQRERINEGAFETATQELLYEGVSPRQTCPEMVGPFSDGSYYCAAKEFGYCDRRSGTCFCNNGYQGIDCTDCIDSYFKIGYHCFPKKNCPDDCNGNGICNYNNGTCSCFSHRTGISCQSMLCSNYNSNCDSCSNTQCLKCQSGYYLTLDFRICSSCQDFDPRCAECTQSKGCTMCVDSTLTSVARSGARSIG
jgi:hypothetical protein